MSGSVQYLIPTDSMTLTDQKDYRQRACIAGVRRAISKSIGSEDDIALVERGLLPNSLDIREFQPTLDALTVPDQWLTAALVVVGTAYSCFQTVAAPVLLANKVGIFYKVGIESIAPVPVSRLIFRKGGIAGNILGVFDLEQLVNQQRIEGYFSSPVVIDPSDTYAVQVLCRVATGVAARVQLGALIIEPKGNTIA